MLLYALQFCYWFLPKTGCLCLFLLCFIVICLFLLFAILFLSLSVSFQSVRVFLSLHNMLCFDQSIKLIVRCLLSSELSFLYHHAYLPQMLNHMGYVRDTLTFTTCTKRHKMFVCCQHNFRKFTFLVSETRLDSCLGDESLCISYYIIRRDAEHRGQTGTGLYSTKALYTSLSGEPVSSPRGWNVCGLR